MNYCPSFLFRRMLPAYRSVNGCMTVTQFSPRTIQKKGEDPAKTKKEEIIATQDAREEFHCSLAPIHFRPQTAKRKANYRLSQEQSWLCLIFKRASSDLKVYCRHTLCESFQFLKNSLMFLYELLGLQSTELNDLELHLGAINVHCKCATACKEVACEIVHVTFKNFTSKPMCSRCLCALIATSKAVYQPSLLCQMLYEFRHRCC